VLGVVVLVALGVLCATMTVIDRVVLRAYRQRVDHSCRLVDEYRALLRESDASIADIQKRYDALTVRKQAAHDHALAELRSIHTASLADLERRYQDSVEGIHTRYAAALVRLQGHMPQPKVLRLHGSQKP
jgi:hypothetical protein